MKSKWWKRLLWLILVIAAVVVVRMTLLKPKPVPVSVYKATRGKVEETVTNSKAGTVKVRRRSELSPEIGGRVVYLGAREGDRVAAGTVLLRMDETEFLASLEAVAALGQLGKSGDAGGMRHIGSCATGLRSEPQTAGYRGLFRQRCWIKHPTGWMSPKRAARLHGPK